MIRKLISVVLRSRFLRAGMLLSMIALASPGTSVAAATPAQNLESKLKGVFLLNFAKLVEWPATAFGNANTPVRIGILGEDPFGDVLDELFRGETARGRPLEVKRAATTDRLTDCHIVFLSVVDEAQLRAWLGSFAGRPVLTVGDQEGFIEAGGMLQFVREGKNLRFQIHADLAATSGLKVSSRILALGKVTSGSTTLPRK
ncbi:MAG: YfiR family protein [Verrucomicrobiales bacterium]|nr:YfiR family protein [Verrucomicrobiales bacterium]